MPIIAAPATIDFPCNHPTHAPYPITSGLDEVLNVVTVVS